MTSVRDRIAAFTRAPSRGSIDTQPPASEKPDGEILYHGWLGKAGAGILASTFNKRYAVLHVAAASGPTLSCYEDMGMERLKGGRLPLLSAQVSQADDKIQITTTDASKPISARFKAFNGSAQAEEWAAALRRAIDGKTVLRTGSSVKAPVASASTASPTPREDTAPPPAATPPAAPQPATPPPPTAVLPTAAAKVPPATTAPTLPVAAPPTASSPTVPSPAAPPPAAPPAAPPPAAPPPAAPAPVYLQPAGATLAGLSSVATRLIALSGGAGASGRPTLTAQSSQEEVAAWMATLVDAIEGCVDGFALQRLESLTCRLERRTGIPSAPLAAAAAAPTRPSDAALARLEGLLVRMEAAAA